MSQTRRAKGGWWSRVLSARNGVLHATLILAATSLVSRLLGLYRDRLFASHFGAGNALDAYYAAFRLPDLVFNLLVLGALSAAFIPVFAEKLARGQEDEAQEVANSLITVTILSLGVIAAVLFAFAYPLTGLLAPGFSHEKRELVATLTRIMLASPILFGVSSIAGGILNAYHRFFAYALAPILYNGGIIFGALVLVPRYGVKGLAFGVVLGATLHFLIQALALRGLGYRYRPRINFSGALRRIYRLMLPRTAALGILQVNLLVETVIGSTLAAGSVAVINLANNLQTVISGIIGLSVATAVFPLLARQASVSDTVAFRETLRTSLRQVLYLTIPLGALVILLRAQIVRVILGTGQFSWQDTKLTAAALGVFAVSIFAQSGIYLLSRAFYALQDTKTPLWASLASAVVNIGASFGLAHRFGVIGLAAGFTLSSLLYLVLLVWLLQRKSGLLPMGEIIDSSLRMAAAALVSSAIAYGTLHGVAHLVNMQKAWGILTQGTIGALVGVVSYLLLTRLIGLEEAGQLWRRLRRRVVGSVEAVS